MALVVKCLGCDHRDGNGEVELYTVPTSKSALVTSVRLVNVGTGTASASVLVRAPGGPNYHLTKKFDTIPASGLLVMEDPVTIQASHSVYLEATGTSSPSIDWIVNGVERDL